MSDNCDSNPVIKLESITMNEEDETNTYDPTYDDTVGDGHTVNDIQIDEEGDIYLRAERSGTGSGRNYTITYTVTDASGNSSSASVEVTVPHEQDDTVKLSSDATDKKLLDTRKIDITRLLSPDTFGPSFLFSHNQVIQPINFANSTFRFPLNNSWIGNTNYYGLPFSPMPIFFSTPFNSFKQYGNFSFSPYGWNSFQLLSMLNYNIFGNWRSPFGLF